MPLLATIASIVGCGAPQPLLPESSDQGCPARTAFVVQGSRSIAAKFPPQKCQACHHRPAFGTIASMRPRSVRRRGPGVLPLQRAPPVRDVISVWQWQCGCNSLGHEEPETHHNSGSSFPPDVSLPLRSARRNQPMRPSSAPIACTWALRRGVNTKDGVLLTVEVTGLPPGLHARPCP